MLKHSIICRFAVLLIACWFQALPAAAEIPFSNGLLFKIQMGGKTPSYLFGTMHSDDPKVVNLPPEVRSRFDDSRLLLLEVKMDAEAMLASMTIMISSDGPDLRSILGDSLYRRCQAAAKQIGIPGATLPFFKPWALATLLSLPPVKTGEFLDLVLYRTAMQGGKPVAGLESVSEQAESLDRLSLSDQTAMLEDTLNNLDQLPIIYQELLDTYLNRDLAGLVRISREGFEQGTDERLERFEESVIVSRNRRMVERLHQHLAAGGGVFTAVGALHLPGEKGMLSLLRGMSYQVDLVY